MQKQELSGAYTVSGINQDEERSTYKGILDLNVLEDNSVKAKWLIGKDQNQFGSGFLVDDTFVIDFYYFDELKNKYTGTVAYKILSPTTLDGFWTEEFGHLDFIGKEQATKILD